MEQEIQFVEKTIEKVCDVRNDIKKYLEKVIQLSCVFSYLYKPTSSATWDFKVKFENYEIKLSYGGFYKEYLFHLKYKEKQLAYLTWKTIDNIPIIVEIYNIDIENLHQIVEFVKIVNTKIKKMKAELQ